MGKGSVGEVFATGEGEFGEGEFLEVGEVGVLELEAVVEVEDAEGWDLGEVLEMFALEIVTIGEVEFSELGEAG